MHEPVSRLTQCINRLTKKLNLKQEIDFYELMMSDVFRNIVSEVVFVHKVIMFHLRQKEDIIFRFMISARKINKCYLSLPTYVFIILNKISFVLIKNHIFFGKS